MRISKNTAAKLRQARKSRGISLETAAYETRISKQHLSALELGKKTGLHESYEAGLFNTYCRYLGIDPATQTKKSQPNPKRRKTPTINKPALRHRYTKEKQMHSGVDLIKRLSIGLVVAAVVIYALWQSLQLVSAPRLVIDQPAGNIVVNTSSLEVRGRTSPGAEVFINNDLLPIEPDGSFNTTVSLRTGVNEIEISALNSLGKRAIVTRTIVFQPQ